MEHSKNFHLAKILIAWEEDLKSSPAFTRSDIDELKSHLLDIYDDMLDKGLEEDEAFLIAVKRLGKPVNWEKEFSLTNTPILFTRKTLLLIAGIILYYCSFYLSLIVAKLIVITGKLLNVETIELIRFDRAFLYILLLIVVLFLNCLFIKERFLIGLLEKIQFRPRHAVFIAIITLFFAAFERSLIPVLKNFITDIYLRNILFEMYMYFEYAYLILLIFGFIILYFRYFKQTSSPLIK